jgi:hypothetical protein
VVILIVKRLYIALFFILISSKCFSGFFHDDVKYHILFIQSEIQYKIDILEEEIEQLEKSNPDYESDSFYWYLIGKRVAYSEMDLYLQKNYFPTSLSHSTN